MKAVVDILRGESTVTDDLAAGVDSIKTLREDQSESMPYIVTEYNLDPIDSNDGQYLDEVEVTIFIYSNYIYTEGANVGAWEIGQNVRNTLTATSGTYGSEAVVKIRLTGESSQMYPDPDRPFVELEQTYLVQIARIPFAYTGISVFSYTNNNQTELGTITPMVASVTGDYRHFKIPETHEAAWATGGLDLNTTTGEITGDLLAGVNVPVLAISKDGETVGVAVVVAAAAGISFEINDAEEGTITSSTTGVNLVDEDENEVVPISVTPVGNKFTIEVTKPIVTLTQAAYNALSPPDANTYYLIDG